jgi:hypothetical protein
MLQEEENEYGGEDQIDGMNFEGQEEESHLMD